MNFRKIYLSFLFSLFLGNIVLSQLNLNKAFPLSSDYGNMIKNLDVVDDSYFISGEFQGDIDMDPDTSISILNVINQGMNGNVYFARYDLQSNLIYAHAIADASSVFVQDQLVDNDKNLYLIGTFGNYLNCEPYGSNYSLSSTFGGLNTDVFIAKYDSLGQLLWAKKLGSTGSQGVTRLKADQNQNIYIIGSFSGTLDFDLSITQTSTLSSNGGNLDPFLAKYNSNGDFIWAKHLNSPSVQDNYNDIQISSDGFIYIAARFGSTADFDFGPDTTNLTAVGTADGAILKYDLNANLIWAKQITGSGAQSVGRIELNSNNVIYVSGTMSTPADLDTDTSAFILTPTGNIDLYFAAFDSDSCDLIWAKRLGGTHNDAIIAGSFYLDQQSNIYIYGGYDYTIDFDPALNSVYNIPGSAVRKAFLSKYDSLGNFIWTNHTSGTDYVDTRQVSFLNDTTLIASFYYPENIDLDFTGNTFMVNVPWHGNNCAIGIYNLADCGNVSIQIDSLTDLNCSVTSGVINTTVYNALPSAQLEWDSNPAFFGDDLTVSENGIYILTYSDSTNCSLSRSVLVEGPEIFPNFDLRCNIIANFFRPGLNGSMIVTGYNTTCDSVGGQIQLIMDNRVQFDSAFIQPDYISGDTLRWDIQDLVYGNNFETLIYYTSDTTLVFTDTVCFDLEITPVAGDQIPNNNTLENCYPVNASYDPNFKQVNPRGDGVDGLITNNLLMNYTIHFQNTGSAEAIDIYILDTISTNLNMHTIEITENSHDVTTEILFPGNIIKFKFDAIHLPDSMNNEPESHGYISYQIYQVPNLALGETIKNTCYIYFDYNDPVKTNEVSNKIGMEIVSANEFEIKEGHTKFYPNPVTDFINFQLFEKSLITIFNSMGQIVYENYHYSGENSVNLQNYSNGLYILKINNSIEKSCQKIIKY